MTSLDVYLIPRDVTETKRLNIQHQIYKETLGYLLNPMVPIKANVRVVDVATGTGIFLLDLPNSIPKDLSPHFAGFDISSSQFPILSNLPSNIKLQTHDILSPFPLVLQGTFDIVHIRLVGQVFHTQQHKKTAINNVTSLLKPGAEIILPPGVEALALKKLFEFTIRQQKKLEWDIETNFAMELKGLLVENNELANVKEDVEPIDRREKRQVRDMMMQNSLGIFGATLKSFVVSGYSDEILGIGNELENDVEGILRAVKSEMESGAVYRYFLYSVIAQKL